MRIDSFSNILFAGQFTSAVVSTRIAMGQAIRSGQLIYGLVFLGLWGIIVVLDRHIIGAEFPYLGLDFEDGWFGIGLNSLTLEPKLWSRRNSPFFNQRYR